MRNVIIAVFALIFCLRISAQSTVYPEIGAGLGASIYQGDLNPNWIGAYNKPGFSFQLQGALMISSFLSVRANYTYAYIRDNEENYNGGVHKLRNFSFETPVNELSVLGIINPRFNNGYEEVGSIRPYFFAGAGVALLNIKRDFSRFNHGYQHWQSWVLPGLTEDSLKTMPTAVVTVPVGMGLRYQIGYNVAIFAEFTKRVTRTEYLDGFSKSANRKENDGFGALLIGLSFRLWDVMGRRGGYDCPIDVY
jgi:hypothetical protein